MGWSEHHKKNSREKILDTAAGLFAHHGFDNVSIDQVMQAAGMTRGAFYAHFRSKADLYSDAIFHAAQRAGADFLPESGATRQQREAFITAYLSESHCDGGAFHCPLAFLVSDMAHQDAEVRATWSRIFQGLVSRMGRGSETTEEEQKASLRQVVMMIGGVAVARALDDKTLAAQVLEACKAVVLDDT